MKRPRIVLSDAEVADILEQSDWYQEQSGDRLAKRWESAVTSAVMRVVETPGAGALCNFKPAELLVRRIRLPDSQSICSSMNSRRRRYLFLRVLHGARDLTAPHLIK